MVVIQAVSDNTKSNRTRRGNRHLKSWRMHKKGTKRVVGNKKEEKIHPFFGSSTPRSRGGQDERRKKTLQVPAREDF